MFELRITPSLYLTVFEILDGESFPVFRRTTNNLHVLEKTRLLEVLIEGLNNGIIPLSRIDSDLGWPKIQFICKEYNPDLSEVFNSQYL